MSKHSWSRLKRWAIDPFVTKVDYYEHARIEHRACPYKLRVQKVPSMQERLDRGGVVSVPDGTWHIDEPLRVGNDTSIVDMRFIGHGASPMMVLGFGEVRADRD